MYELFCRERKLNLKGQARELECKKCKKLCVDFNRVGVMQMTDKLKRRIVAARNRSLSKHRSKKACSRLSVVIRWGRADVSACAHNSTALTLS